MDGRIARQYDKDMEIALAQDEVAAAVVQNHFPDASKMAGATSSSSNVIVQVGCAHPGRWVSTCCRATGWVADQFCRPMISRVGARKILSSSPACLG